jgi:hypothetical protein
MQEGILIVELLRLDLHDKHIFKAPADTINMLKVCCQHSLSALSYSDLTAILRGVSVPAVAATSTRVYHKGSQHR